jgi:hypothetical protein
MLDTVCSSCGSMTRQVECPRGNFSSVVPRPSYGAPRAPSDSVAEVLDSTNAAACGEPRCCVSVGQDVRGRILEELAPLASSSASKSAGTSEYGAR